MNRLLFILIACLLGFPALLAKAEEPALITAQDYCRFLKCVAVSDPHCFYNEKLALDPTCIVREGIPGNYSYSVLPGKEKQLVSYLNWHDVACYAYWKKQEEDHFNDDFTLSSGGFQVDDAAQSSDQELKSNIVHFSLINDQALDEEIPSSKEPPSWISYMMIPILFLGEEGNPEDRVLPHDEESSHLKEKARENITEPLALSNANTSPLLSQVLTRFIENANRIDSICKKKEEYQQELKILSPDSNRALMLNDLIPILEKAILHQDTSTGRLIKNIGTSSGSEKEALKTFRIAEYAMMINGRPNKVELIAKQIEEDHKHLTAYQDKFLEVQTLIESQPNQFHLIEACAYLTKAIELQCALIERRAIYAQALPLPYEQLDKTTQAEIEKNKWYLVKETALAQREYVLAQSALAWDQPDKASYLDDAGSALFLAAQEAQKQAEIKKEEVINLFQDSATLSQEAANAWNPDQSDKAHYLHNASIALFEAAKETQKQPELKKEEVINWLRHAAALSQEAGNTWNPNQANKARCLDIAGAAFFEAAKEAQKILRNQDVIDLFQHAANLFKEAGDTWNPDQPDKTRCLYNVGLALLEAAKEMQKQVEIRKQGVIDLFQRSAILSQKAHSIWDPDQPWDPDHPGKARYFDNAGTALFQAAKETQKPEPNLAIIASLIKRAEALEERATL